MENYKETAIIGSPACMWECEWEHNKFTYTIIYLNKVWISAPVTLCSQRSQIARQKRLKEKGFSQSVIHCYNTTCSCYISKTGFKTEIRLPLMLFYSSQNTAHDNPHCCSTAVREISLHLRWRTTTKTEENKENAQNTDIKNLLWWIWHSPTYNKVLFKGGAA